MNVPLAFTVTAIFLFGCSLFAIKAGSTQFWLLLIAVGLIIASIVIPFK